MLYLFKEVGAQQTVDGVEKGLSSATKFVFTDYCMGYSVLSISHSFVFWVGLLFLIWITTHMQDF